jgi:hypothetical protein
MQAEAFCDLPIPLYYKSYAERFPDARFILTTRSEESWLRSMDWLIKNGPKIWGGPNTTWGPNGPVKRVHKLVFGTTEFEPAKMLEVYRTHNAEVLHFFSNDPRFLHLRLEDTPLYEDLADFIGIETSLQGPLPRANPSRRPLPPLVQKIRRRLGCGK